MMNTDEQDEERTLQLRDFAEEDKPREKLMIRGRRCLSDEELIAIFLRTGLHGCNVLELAAKLKREAGSLAALGSMEAQDIQRLAKGIGMAKAATLAAVFELGKRAVQESIMREPLRGAEDVYRLLAPSLRFENQENLVLLLLDVRRCLIRKETIARGTLTRLVVHPRDIFNRAVRYQASSIMIAHNHPSGNPTPSRQDIQLTEAIRAAGEVMMIPLRDHVIIGAETGEGGKPYYSFLEHGVIPA